MICGAPAVGKSSTAQAVADTFDRSLHVPVDDLRTMVRSGLVLPSPHWTDELVLQVGLARSSALDIARRYRAAGFAVVLDDFLDPPGLVEYSELAEDDRVVRVCLRPDLAAAIARNRARAASEGEREYLDRGIRAIYGQLSAQGPALERAGWVMLDNTGLSIEQTADAILGRLPPVTATLTTS